MEKKQLLIVSRDQALIDSITEKVSVVYEVTTEAAIHAAFNCALSLLPDTILFDKTSYNKVTDFKNLKNFKSTHFLTRSYLLVLSKREEIPMLNRRYKSIIDEFIPAIQDDERIAERIKKASFKNQVNFNYWYECFMGLFNLMAKPVLLLQQNAVLGMNDSFKKTFKIEQKDGLKLTDFVNIENKAKLKSSIRNFVRGKHHKAVTHTSILIGNDKVRNARISLSKLSRNITDQFIMIIDFAGEEYSINQAIGSRAGQIEKCFEENSELAEFCFTKREKEIMELLCKGYKTKEISETLFISPKTIEKHRSNIIKRTNSETILESVVFALNHKLIQSPFS
ncbi:MAG: LuxR C-terminal-related transcriptional regulator [Bacteroidota bacterium]|uniref:Two-component response regulator yvqC n=1 Tax=Christiangramia flava JLT2011 TaxID=1229726 RepID=A0A1L7I194_9FLAO|nr:LuxR C-terminal-related transcriptional regulator [Christiangramia flava]APU66852.1 Two-component response regulator yvqC [Christiangramia flava JLT2011]MAM19484.1 DNA-binding response regulator [Christiangramia sp.]MEE2772842.1 LuxR C-terminal-related transcriptional regulator [Bacteroidota bacterium]